MKHSLLLFMVLLLVSCTTEKQTLTGSLPRSSTEAEGIDPEGIIRFLEAFKSNEMELHSFMIVRHGKVVSEGWFAPFADTLNHGLASVTKTFTSTAVGFAVSEKLISVDDKVIKFFPESLPDTVSPYLESLAVKHLLTMSVGQKSEPQFSLEDENIVKTFFEYPITKEPGTVFNYSSYASHILSAIVQKVSGQKVEDYLESRLFEPLAIKNIVWMADASGISTGGWGLSVKTEDLAKLGQLYLQKGKWNGKQLLPESWIEEATTLKIYQKPDLHEMEKKRDDWAQGYCYQIWRNIHGYRADGANGQFIVVLPEQDVVVALTANIGDMQKELSLVWDHLLPAIHDKALPENPEYKQKLDEMINALAVPVAGGPSASPVEAKISGKTYRFEKNDFLLDNLTVYCNDDNNILKISVFNQNYEISMGKGFWSEPSGNEQFSASCFWTNDHTLSVKFLSVLGFFSPHFDLKFDGDKITFTGKNFGGNTSIEGVTTASNSSE